MTATCSITKHKYHPLIWASDALPFKRSEVCFFQRDVIFKISNRLQDPKF